MSLHSTTVVVRKIFYGGLIGVGILFAFFIVPGILKSLTPKKIPPPTVSFGKLPPVAFPQQTTTTPVTEKYSINTVSGLLPILPDRATIYPMVQYQSDLLDLDKAKALVSTGDFPNPPQALSETLYEWDSPNAPFKILQYNILTHDFTLTSSYITDPIAIAANNLGDQNAAVSIAKNFLASFNAYTSDIDETKTKTTLYSINGETQQLQPAISLSTTQIMQVDFFQQDVNKLPIYYPDAPHSLITTIVAMTNTGEQVVQATVVHKAITDQSGTYPIKTAQQAFQELQTASSSAYIAAPANPPMNPVIIRDVSLGYYMGKDSTYLMPIIIFQGDNGFFAYVSAVANAWIQQ